jgi:hypothetical protein
MKKYESSIRETIQGSKVRIIRSLGDGIYLVEAITQKSGTFITWVAEEDLLE